MINNYNYLLPLVHLPLASLLFFYFHSPQRNGTLPEVYTIHTGQNGMENFGYYDNINGAKTLPFWPAAPCNSIEASEGSLFPPRDVTGSDTVFVYDKDVCRTLPFTYKKPVVQNGMYGKSFCTFSFVS